MVSDDRGQLILVGAVAIALVLLGLVLVVNTALFTQVVGSEGTVETTREGSVGAAGAGDSIAAVIHDANVRESTISNVENEVTATLDADYDALVRNRSLNAGGAYVNASYIDETETGTVVAQTTSQNLTNPDGTPTWDPFSSGVVGHYNLTVDVPNSSGSVDIQASNAMTTRTLTIDASASDQVTLSNAGASGCTGIDATQDTVRIDLREGRVYEDSDCSFDLFDGLDGTYSVEISGGDDVNGTYVLVTNGSVSLVSGVLPPETTEAIWAFEYSYEYDTDDVTVESGRREVDVYG